MAMDTKKCECIKYKINQIIASTDYPEKPTIPNHLGNPGMFNKQPTTEQYKEVNRVINLQTYE